MKEFSSKDDEGGEDKENAKVLRNIFSLSLCLVIGEQKRGGTTSSCCYDN